MDRILIVDDDEQIRRIIDRTLGRHGYSCVLAADAAQAREILNGQAFDLVLCDVNMPGESGVDLAGFITSEYVDTAVIMVTGVDDPNTADSAIKAGTYGYVIKPFNPNELIINTRNALRRRELEITNRIYRKDLEKMVDERTNKLHKTLANVINAMARTVESRDPYTAGHQARVADLAAAIATEMNIEKDKIEGIRMAGMIHDLGKISVPAEILSKPTQLTDMEFSIVKAHSKTGYDIIADIDFSWPIAQIILQHHEKIDGSGYPQGLSGEEILLEARILCVADVVEAMASHRPYRPALGIEKAMDAILKGKGKIFEPEVVDTCIKVIDEGRFKLEA